MRRTGLREVYLKPGEMYFARRPARITTVLGSCVTVTMYAPEWRMGAICHGLLPVCGRRRHCDGSCADGLRFMDCSIKRMIRCLEKEGIALKRVTAKVFGGSDMFQSRYDNGRSSVGAQNIQATYHALREIGMPVSACDVGGDVGRKIIFCSDTGDVFLKRLRVMNEEVPGVLQAISGFAGGVI